jgi:hypothetical protein
MTAKSGHGIPISGPRSQANAGALSALLSIVLLPRRHRIAVCRSPSLCGSGSGDRAPASNWELLSHIAIQIRFWRFADRLWAKKSREVLTRIKRFNEQMNLIGEAV